MNTPTGASTSTHPTITSIVSRIHSKKVASPARRSPGPCATAKPNTRANITTGSMLSAAAALNDVDRDEALEHLSHAGQRRQFRARSSERGELRRSTSGGARPKRQQERRNDRDERRSDQQDGEKCQKRQARDHRPPSSPRRATQPRSPRARRRVAGWSCAARRSTSRRCVSAAVTMTLSAWHARCGEPEPAARPAASPTRTRTGGDISAPVRPPVNAERPALSLDFAANGNSPPPQCRVARH